MAGVSAAANPASPVELLSLGRVDDAIRLLQERVRAVPNDAQAYSLLTRTYFYMGRWDEAAAAAERAAALDPSASDYQLWLGRAAGEKAAHASFVTAVRMVPRIRGAFERAVQLDGLNSEARTDLAEFYMEAPAFLGGGKDKALAQAGAGYVGRIGGTLGQGTARAARQEVRCGGAGIPCGRHGQQTARGPVARSGRLLS